MPASPVPDRTLERLSLYRRIARNQYEKGKEFLFSHELARLSHRKSSQVRKDFSYLTGLTSSSRGYDIQEMIKSIGKVLDSEAIQKMAIVGVGNMGRAFINFFKGRGRNLCIAAAFDINEGIIDRVINGCRCYHINRFREVIEAEDITIGIITVPESAAQQVHTLMADSGIRAIINVAPVPLSSTEKVYVENLDFTSYFEKTAYFAKSHR